MRVGRRLEKLGRRGKPTRMGCGSNCGRPSDSQRKLVEFSFWLSKQAYDEDVVKWRTNIMKRLVSLGANLWNPETIKVLAKQKWNDGYKMLIVYAYENFLKMEGLCWQRPKYKQPEVLPFIPTETELDQLIAASGKKLGTFLQGLKDTGADPGELAMFQWTDINAESRTIQIRPVKGHNPRVLTISQQFVDKLQRLKTLEKTFNLQSLERCLPT
jgi:integrase